MTDMRAQVRGTFRCAQGLLGRCAGDHSHVSGGQGEGLSKGYAPEDKVTVIGGAGGGGAEYGYGRRRVLESHSLTMYLSPCFMQRIFKHEDFSINFVKCCGSWRASSWHVTFSN